MLSQTTVDLAPELDGVTHSLKNGAKNTTHSLLL